MVKNKEGINTVFILFNRIYCTEYSTWIKCKLERHCGKLSFGNIGNPDVLLYLFDSDDSAAPVVEERNRVKIPNCFPGVDIDDVHGSCLCKVVSWII